MDICGPFAFIFRDLLAAAGSSDVRRESRRGSKSCQHGGQMLLAALLIYVAITGVVVFALAVAASTDSASDVPIADDAEIVELALSKVDDERRRAS